MRVDMIFPLSWRLLAVLGGLAGLGAWGLPASAAPASKLPPPTSPAPYYTLGRINGEASHELSIVNIRFDRKPEWKELASLDAHGSFLQMRLPATIAPEPGTFYDGGSPYISKIAVYQSRPDEAMIRLFTSVDAKLVKESLDRDILDSRLVITLDHRSLKSKLASLELPAPQGGASVASGAFTPASLSGDAGSAASALKAPVAAAAPIATAPPDVGLASANSLLNNPGSLAPNQSSLNAQSLASAEPTNQSPGDPASAAAAFAAEGVAAAQAAQAAQAAATSAAIVSPSKETGSLAAQPKTTKPSPWWSGWTGAAANDSASLDSRLRALALFSILFFGLVLLALTGRRLMRNHRILSTPDNVIRMQTLSDLTLAPKQKLTLVQVGNERLLLAVSPDGVSLITHLPGNEAPAPSEKPRVVEPARLSASRPGPSAASELKRAPSPTPSELEPAVREARTSNPRRLASSPAATPSPRPAAPASSERADSPRRINYAIDDEGVHEQTLEATPKLRRDPSTEKAIDDVTKLIREKLKSLPKIS